MKYFIKLIVKGPRDAEALINFAGERMEKFGIDTSVDQIISQEQLNENCVDRVAVCIVAFLPNIYDSTAAQRKEYIKELTEVKPFLNLTITFSSI